MSQAWIVPDGPKDRAIPLSGCLVFGVAWALAALACKGCVGRNPLILGRASAPPVRTA